MRPVLLAESIEKPSEAEAYVMGTLNGASTMADMVRENPAAFHQYHRELMEAATHLYRAAHLTRISKGKKHGH